jgi:hypothetical protein
MHGQGWPADAGAGRRQSIGGHGQMLKRRKREKFGTRQETRIRCPAHLAYVRLHVCAVQDFACGGKIEAAHIRMGTDGALGRKPSDCFAIPMCSEHHRMQHAIGELKFWATCQIDPLKLAAQLWKASPHRRKWEQKQS